MRLGCCPICDKRYMRPKPDGSVIDIYSEFYVLLENGQRTAISMCKDCLSNADDASMKKAFDDTKVLEVRMARKESDKDNIKLQKSHSFHRKESDVDKKRKDLIKKNRDKKCKSIKKEQ